MSVVVVGYEHQHRVAVVVYMIQMDAFGQHLHMLP